MLRAIAVIATVLIVAVEPLFAKSLNGFDLSNCLIPIKHIVQGGPPRDGIPALVDPHYVHASDARFLAASDFVLGFERDGHAFAFPRHIMSWHELVNGEVNGFAFLITYCPLCGTGMAFSSEVGGESLEFGVSGLLYNNDVIFYDRQSESLWSQLERRSISGKHAGVELEQLHLTHTTWSRWREKHPQTKVLSENQGFKRNYRHEAYGGYETSSLLFFKTLRKTPKEFHTKERVMGVTIDGTAKAYPFVELRRHASNRFKDSIADRSFLILWDEAHETASIETADGTPVVTTISYWFAWYNFHPETEIFRSHKSP